MYKLVSVLAAAAITIVATLLYSEVTSAKDASEYQYEVLSPWAEADPVPVRGISPRVDTLSGKKIGLFLNEKRAAKPIQKVVEKRLKARFPNCETSFFEEGVANVVVTETKNKDRFTAWAKEMDAVIAAVGD